MKVLSENPIRAVFFDAVGTLIHPQPPPADVYAAVGRCFGSRLDAAAVGPRFRAAFRRQEEQDRELGYRTDDAREVRRWRTIVGEVLDDVTDPDACFWALFEHFARPGAWRCAPDAGPVLRALAAARYPLGLASNYDKRLHAVADGLPELRPLGYRVISAEVGFCKPAAGFYLKLCGLAHAAAQQVLVVGDDFANDYEGAVAAGLSAALYDPDGAFCDRAVVRVGRLCDLPTLLTCPRQRE